MSAQEESQQPQEVDVNKAKLIYSPPEVIFIGSIQDVKAKGIGLSETVCGCGPFS